MTAKFFNLPYTVWFLFMAGCLSLFLCISYIYYRNKFITTYAYLPYGRASNADQLPNVNWIKLTSPCLPETSVINGIVADLHEPELDNHWQKFLARQTLNRSEERRVGKGCRCRWGPAAYKTKQLGIK